MAQSQSPTSSSSVPGAPAGSASGGAGAPGPSSGPTEIVTRPEPGIARGVWEAPAWAFWGALGLLVVVTTLYALQRAGLLRRPGRAPRGPSAS